MKGGKGFHEVAEILEFISRIYSEVGCEGEAEKYETLTIRLRNGEADALHMTKAEARGAMGWGLGDRYFCRTNGDSATQEEEVDINTRFQLLLTQLNESLQSLDYLDDTERVTDGNGVQTTPLPLDHPEIIAIDARLAALAAGAPPRWPDPAHLAAPTPNRLSPPGSSAASPLLAPQEGGDPPRE